MATYTRFNIDPEIEGTGDVVDDIQKVFASAWSGGVNDLGSNHFSSSVQYVTSNPTGSGAFFMEVFDKHPINDDTAEVQYSIAYGSKTVKGGLDFNDDTGAENISSTKAIYSQYRNLVFGGDETQNFTFDGYTPDDIYVININRARYKDQIRLGNVQLHLSSSANHLLHLTDDSVTTSGSANAFRAGVGREFNIVSGSNGVRLGSSNTYVTNSGSFGFIYPDAGFIILNADAADKDFLANEGIADCDVYVAVTQDDETNVLCSLMAKKLGAKKTITIINNDAYFDLIGKNELDIIISPVQITVSYILKYVRKGSVSNVHKVKKGKAEVLEITIDNFAEGLKGKKISELEMGDSIEIPCLQRGESVVIAHKETELLEGDHLIIFYKDKKAFDEFYNKFK